MRIDKDLLKRLGVNDKNADKYADDMATVLPTFEIDTPLRVAHFLAQCLHETGKLKIVVENMNYTTEEQLLKVFGSHIRAQEASEFVNNPEKIGNRVYAGRLGNGNEASGDGYRYRGRGLIQITGKDNYRKFSETVEEDDILTNPDLIATKYAVRSAAWYWDKRAINSYADADDVREVTRRIVGNTLRGLARRTENLDKAKELLVYSPSVDYTHSVTATQLNLRSRPVVRPNTKIVLLAQGTLVRQLDDTGTGWYKIQTILRGRIVEGFVANRYLEKISAEEPEIEPVPLPTYDIPIAHMTENRRSITRQRDAGRAYPLGEADRPKRRNADPDSLIKIVDYLDSEDEQHKRYRPKGGKTYCNIYAYDYCYLSGVYLPRVWWKDSALRQIRNGAQPSVEYDTTVRELNANMLHDWFDDYGCDFGWKREFDLDVLQASANQGQVCIIVAKRDDISRSGHIAAVVPEHDDIEAKRNASGSVLRPVESQAGSTNYRFVVKSSQWWAADRYRSFGFWRHM